MTYQIKMMNNDTFNISEDTFQKLEGKTGLVHFKEIDAILNLNSVASILPAELVNEKQRTLSDGTRIINKFGTWYLENNQEVKVDLNYYPELKERTSELKQITK